MKFTNIYIIYNPKSTGSGHAMAQKLQAELAEKLPRQKVSLVATKRAGHAEELAYKFGLASTHPLIISASGDGGYHEVVNGLMNAQEKGAKPIAGLLPAGNANDHFHNLHDNNIADAIVNGEVQTIDLLKLRSKISGKAFERYAHSYIGIGLTPKVGNELNKRKLNAINEIGIVLRVLLFLRPVKIVIYNKKGAYDSLIFSNIQKMSKVLDLSDSSRPNDGKFEITLFKRRNKLALLGVLLRASVIGLKGNRRLSKFRFMTTKPLLTQLDGEIYKLDARTFVNVEVANQRLRCIV